MLQIDRCKKFRGHRYPLVYGLLVLLASFVWTISIQANAATDNADANSGQKIFEQNCAACHTIGKGVLVGPDLAGVTEQRPREWLLRWIAAPDRMLAEKDPVATQLLQKFHVPMPNLHLSPAQVEAVVDYLGTAGTVESAAASTSTASGGAATASGSMAAPAPIEATGWNRQNVAFTIWVVGALLILLGFWFVISNAERPANDEEAREVSHRSHVLQAWAFGVLLVIFAVGSWATLHKFPIPPQHTALDAQQIVNVVGHQWYWQIKPDRVTTGSVVEFRVTSGDVNHGFAIYAPDGQVVTQTQAMPGYTNKVLYTFSQPGTYTVRCLEYCGLGHAPMHMTFEVDTPKGGV